ncbi:cytosine/adenosine deaminase-related metal-dependent hydrolase [Isoptericola jiangsuensis]|uniref:Cytosine/adenosine deaminase-related metal-dependent hydrolase n=1 Tax=Isoptericola jiangsuensis TaxID=548579 RepID=A0A2A9EVR7_9MICO|nr:8-oxoguanine deaminase [Isoptericola jiangsuensis]PFG42611.1 cytosine/adenosine deaminase-related metal-dependent hydrolase [Isoptericola jiangsuensis]
MTRTILENGHVATVDAAGTEHAVGHVVIEAGVVTAVGPGRAPEHLRDGADVVDASGCLVTPGLVNTHHHLYQWLTRGYAQDSILFDWLTSLYPLWSRIDADLTGAGAAGAMAVLARSGCTTVGDHHYVFPQGSGDIVGALVESAATVGVRLHATRGSMDLGASSGGLPPDFAVETTDAALKASQAAVEAYHDPSRDATVRIAIAPCSPFSVTKDLLREAAVLARSLDVRLHTHASETVEEDAYCAEHFGSTPTQYLEDLGWLGDDVWMAHGVHLDAAAIARYAATGTGVAHCPSSNARLAAGIAPVRDLLDAGVPVGLGVDGAASNESGQLGTEIRESVLMNRLRTGADSMSVRDALRVATIGGARVLGRHDEIGSLEPGKLADVAVWQVDGVEHAGILDPVAALGLGALPPLKRLYVGGRTVVEDAHLATADEQALARGVAVASRELAERL